MELTNEQKEVMEQIRDQWTEAALSTEPAVRDGAEQVIARIYQREKLGVPLFVWCDSPWHGNTTVTWMLDIWHKPCEAMYQKVAAKGGYSHYVYMVNELALYLDDVRAGRTVLVGGLSKDDLGPILEHLAQIPLSHQSGNLSGNLDSHWVGYYKFAQYLGMKLDEEKQFILDAWEKLAMSVCWWYPRSEFCFCTERPIDLHYDRANDYLHNATGAAAMWPDNFKFYCYKGLLIHNEDSNIITDPGSVTADRIHKQQNAELRRAMLEIMGLEKYFTQIPHVLVDQWPERGLQLYNSTVSINGRERRLQMMISVCPSTGRKYPSFLDNRQTQFTSVEQAMTWRYGVEKYAPSFES